MLLASELGEALEINIQLTNDMSQHLSTEFGPAFEGFINTSNVSDDIQKATQGTSEIH